MATFNLNTDELEKLNNIPHPRIIEPMTPDRIDELVTLKAMYSCKDYDTAVYYLNYSQVDIINHWLEPYIENKDNYLHSYAEAFDQVCGIIISDVLEDSDYNYAEIRDFVYEDFDEPSQLEKYQDLYKKEGLDATVKQIMKDNNNEDPGWIVFYKDELFPDKTVKEIEKSINKIELSDVKPVLNHFEMQQIREGFESGLSKEQVELYAKPELKGRQMEEIRKGLENGNIKNNQPSPEPVKDAFTQDLERRQAKSKGLER